MEDLKARQAQAEKEKQEKLEKRVAESQKQKKPNIKRPLSAFLRFSVQRRKEIVKENPDLRHPKYFKDVAQKISKEWKDLDVKKKKRIEDEAAADFEEYRKKVLEWKASYKRGKKRRKVKKPTRRAK